MGKREEQIKKIVNLLNDSREKWIKEFEKSSSLILNDIAHNRFMDEDFEGCKTYIEDILKYIPEF